MKDIKLTQEQSRVFLLMAIGHGLAAGNVGNMARVLDKTLEEVEALLDELRALGLAQPPKDSGPDRSLS